ncbi:MAG: ATP-binding protein [Candidatus Cloacimonadaceae bacterium]|jgi:MinD superfamily P-loop ATPase|nr:ATP-binding protein [Candidatus Cloacimonadaceae bacterium]
MRIAIASGKGGTGKTTLAVNLALKLAEHHSTALMDLDVEEPNSGIFLSGLEIKNQRAVRMVPQWDQKSCSLCGKCPTHCRYNAVIRLGDYIMVLPELCHSCYACSELCPDNALPMQEQSLGQIRHLRSGNLDFVESRLDIGLEQASPLIGQALDYADSHFENHKYQILDSPPGTSCAMISATKTADYAILISEPTPFGLYDLSLAVETMRHLEIDFGVVVNRWGIGNSDILDYLDKEHITLLAKIPHNREIAKSYSQGEILYQSFPEVDQAISKIIRHLEGIA